MQETVNCHFDLINTSLKILKFQLRVIFVFKILFTLSIVKKGHT